MSCCAKVTIDFAKPVRTNDWAMDEMCAMRSPHRVGLWNRAASALGAYSGVK